MRQAIEREKINQSIARLKTHGQNFEVVIDPDSAIAFRKGAAEINTAVLTAHVYKNVQQGELASEEHMKQIFGTCDAYEVASKIIRDGEIHLTDDYKEELRNQKKHQIFEILCKEGAEEQTGTPLTEKMLQHALSQSKMTIDLYKSSQDQIKDFISRVRPYLQITLEKKSVQITIPSTHAAKLYGTVSSKSRIISENWLNDGSWTCKAEVAAGAVVGLLDELKKKTHGDVEITVLK